jgi:5-carboxymethyl-2-hydroxymuconate isomerase
MPHIVCHYSADQEMPPISEVLMALHVAAASTGVVKAEDLKIRAQSFDEYLVAGKAQSFFHVSRTPQQKETLSIELRSVLSKLLDNTHSISIDIRDMDPDAYKKRLK